MKLSTKGRYAVMAMAELALRGRGGPVKMHDIAKAQELSPAYLDQLFLKLRRAGLIVSARGPGGGYLLAREADGVSIAEIMSAVDEPIRATRCGPGGVEGCMGDLSRCLTHDLWDDLGRHILLFLENVSLGDVVEKRRAACGALAMEALAEWRVGPEEGRAHG